MKKIIIAMIFMLPLHILALDIEQTYLQAMNAYKTKDYQTSYELFSKLYLTKLSDTSLNFNLGVSAYETGHYEVALAAFERVEMLQPTNLRNKLEMARTYFMLKMYEDSELLFKEVLANPMIPENVRKNIELYLSKVTKVQEKSFTYVTIEMDAVYDSNVNYGSIDDTYNIGNSAYPTADEKSDMALQLSADIVNIYDIGEANGFAIKNRISGYLKNYKEEKAYDISYIGYSPSLVYKYTKYTAEMVLGANIMSLGGESYLQTLSVMPRFEYTHTNTLVSSAYLKYQKKSFLQDAQYDLDSKHYEISYGLQDILSPRSYAQVNVSAIMEKKDHGRRIDVDYKEYALDALYANQFTPTYGAEFYAEIKNRKYDDYSTLFSSTRDDVSKSVSATLNVKILETLRLRVKALYNRVDSNQNVFSYQKYAVSAGIVKTF
jgi:hypothetical protein